MLGLKIGGQELRNYGPLWMHLSIDILYHTFEYIHFHNFIHFLTLSFVIFFRCCYCMHSLLVGDLSNTMNETTPHRSRFRTRMGPLVENLEITTILFFSLSNFHFLTCPPSPSLSPCMPDTQRTPHSHSHSLLFGARPSDRNGNNVYLFIDKNANAIYLQYIGLV